MRLVRDEDDNPQATDWSCVVAVVLWALSLGVLAYLFTLVPMRQM